jgi:hypothetical protein
MRAGYQAGQRVGALTLPAFPALILLAPPPAATYPELGPLDRFSIAACECDASPVGVADARPNEVVLRETEPWEIVDLLREDRVGHLGLNSRPQTGQVVYVSPLAQSGSVVGRLVFSPVGRENTPRPLLSAVVVLDDLKVVEVERRLLSQSDLDSPHVLVASPDPEGVRVDRPTFLAFLDSARDLEPHPWEVWVSSRSDPSELERLQSAGDVNGDDRPEGFGTPLFRCLEVGFDAAPERVPF